jgi:hypothetical protein
LFPTKQTVVKIMVLPLPLNEKGKPNALGILLALGAAILAYVLIKWVVAQFSETRLDSYDAQGNKLGSGALKTVYKRPDFLKEKPAPVPPPTENKE